METIHVPDMMCEHCVKRIREVMSRLEIDGVVDLVTKSITGDHLESLIPVLKQMGYHPEIK